MFMFIPNSTTEQEARQLTIDHLHTLSISDNKLPFTLLANDRPCLHSARCWCTSECIWLWAISSTESPWKPSPLLALLEASFAHLHIQLAATVSHVSIFVCFLNRMEGTELDSPGQDGKAYDVVSKWRILLNIFN